LSKKSRLARWHAVTDGYLREEGGGTIVNIGSFFDKLGVKRNSAYCASKAAVGAITRCLAVEWASDGIRVHNAAPGYIVRVLPNRRISTLRSRRHWDIRWDRLNCSIWYAPYKMAALVEVLSEQGISSSDRLKGTGVNAADLYDPDCLTSIRQ
jgi:NAD(P)-dependent dehydrogenase (short-subunit alcohol dehydrogenase family)